MAGIGPIPPGDELAVVNPDDLQNLILGLPTGQTLTIIPDAQVWPVRIHFRFLYTWYSPNASCRKRKTISFLAEKIRLVWSIDVDAGCTRKLCRSERDGVFDWVDAHEETLQESVSENKV